MSAPKNDDLPALVRWRGHRLLLFRVRNDDQSLRIYDTMMILVYFRRGDIWRWYFESAKRPIRHWLLKKLYNYFVAKGTQSDPPF